MINYRLTINLIDRASRKVELTHKSLPVDTLPELHTALVEYAEEWRMPPPPSAEDVKAQIEDKWNEDLGMSEIAFDVDILGPKDPVCHHVIILAHD